MAESHTKSAAALHCVVVTPETTVLDAQAEFIALPLYDGEVGILPGRSPLIGRLGYGEMRIKKGGETLRYYVDGGFVQVVDNNVSVLTNRAVPAAQIDPAAAAELLRTAQSRPAAGEEALLIRDRLTLQARGQLRVAERAQA
jgi:F-type H+-transporting ATPase subunit epsilon